MRKLPSNCMIPGCPGLSYEHGYCSEHMYLYKQSKRSTTKPYGPDWYKISRKFLSDNPICELCGAKAEVSHHIVERSDGGEDIPDNLMALCSKCHNKIHAENKLHQRNKRYTY